MRWGTTAKLLLIPAVATVVLLWALGLTFQAHGRYEQIIGEMNERWVSLSNAQLAEAAQPGGPPAPAQNQIPAAGSCAASYRVDPR